MNNYSSRVVVVGNRNLARQILRYLLDKEWNVVGTVGAAGDAAQKQAGFESFDQLADSYGIELVETTDLNSEQSKRELAELSPDICICPAWHQILDPSVLDIPDVGFLGFHSSDLPRGRGGAPINWSIIHGNEEIHICLFEYVPGVDAGPILDKQSVPVQARDDVRSIIDRLAVAACDALSEVRPTLERGTVHSTPQSVKEATYRPRRQPQDGLIDWSTTVSEVNDWIRAQTDPYPGAYTFYEDEKLVVWDLEIPEQTDEKEHAPGTITATHEGSGLNIAVSDGIVRLTRLQPANRPRMWADSFATRYEVEAGDQFGELHAPESWLYTGIRDENGGTDFSDTTNLALGETARIRAVIQTGQQRDIRVRAQLNDRKILSKELSVDAAAHMEIEGQPDDSGTRTLAVEFCRNGETIDTRYLKLFVH